MGITSKIAESYKTRLSSRAAERQRRSRPRAERAAGDLSGIADNKRELAFAAVLVLVGIAALYPALYSGVSSFLSDTIEEQTLAQKNQNSSG